MRRIDTDGHQRFSFDDRYVGKINQISMWSSMIRFHSAEGKYDVPISFAQAALGAEVIVPTLNGKETISIPAGTQSESRFRLRGHGVPDLNGGGQGDQWITVHVRTPKRLSEEQRALLTQLAELDGDETGEPGLFDRVKNIFG